MAACRCGAGPNLGARTASTPVLSTIGFYRTESLAGPGRHDCPAPRAPRGTPGGRRPRPVKGPVCAGCWGAGPRHHLLVAASSRSPRPATNGAPTRLRPGATGWQMPTKKPSSPGGSASPGSVMSQPIRPASWPKPHGHCLTARAPPAPATVTVTVITNPGPVSAAKKAGQRRIFGPGLGIRAHGHRDPPSITHSATLAVTSALTFNFVHVQWLAAAASTCQ
jgi:hypothetical protein